jgi:hypothetical protein
MILVLLKRKGLVWGLFENKLDANRLILPSSTVAMNNESGRIRRHMVWRGWETSRKWISDI